MSWKTVLGFLFFIIVVGLLVFYWLIPVGEIDFGTFKGPGHSNFTLNSSNEENMQFYPNLRYSESRISYRIENCPLSKESEMIGAFDTIQSNTILEFYPVSSNEEILVTCESTAKFEGEFFIAGEGGPTNITQAGDFNVIKNGGIVLIRESNCQNPNVATHELLHALGFDHSQNPDNVLYPVSRCDQELGEDTLNLIDELYSVPSQPDLTFESATATMNGRYLDVTMTIRNQGLTSSEDSKILIYADEDLIKEIDMSSLSVGAGKLISLTNILVLQTSVSEVRLLIEHGAGELKKDNNEVLLKIDD